MDDKKNNRSKKHRNRRKQLLSGERAHHASSCSAPGPGSSGGAVQTGKVKGREFLSRQRCKNAHRKHSASSSRTKDGDSSSSSAEADFDGSDIPGYYYDEKTKLYFKVQPYNLGGVAAPFITKDKIVSKQKEDQRKLDVENLSTSTASCTTGVSTHRWNTHIVNVLKSVQCGQFTCENLQTHMIRHMCSRIQPDSDWDNSLPGQPSLLLGEIQNMEVSKKRDKLVCVSSLKSSYSQVIQLMTVDKHKQPHSSKTKSTVLRVNVPFLALGPVHKRIKTLCWAPMNGRSGQATVFYTTVCPIGSLASVAYISNLEAEAGSEPILFELNLGKNIIWSSAWSTHGHRFTIGAERRCCLIDVETRKQWTIRTFDSDPLSQLFHHYRPIIYNGTRKGQIVLHDVREMGRCSLVMRQAPGVGCLRLQQDENYLMASDFSGTICTWDQRMRKKVMEYSGLMNSHWQLPFHLDETEMLLTSTGSDSYTQIWDVRSGDIQRTIPPIYPVSCDNFPLSFYSTCWGSKDGNAALLVAMRNRFRFYTYKETFSMRNSNSVIVQ